MKRQGGGKRKGRRPASALEDDRPRGYEAQRMHRLWSDIDQAKHKAGLGPAPDPAEPLLWDLTVVVDRLSTIATDATTWLASTPSLRSALALITSGTDLLKSLPILGSLIALLPLPSTNGHHTPNGHPTSNGTPRDPDEIQPNGEWHD